MSKKIARGVGIGLAVLRTIRIVAGCFVPSLNLNDVTTGVTAEYPDLQPQSFAQPYEEVFDAAAAVARELGWKLTREDRGTGVVQAIATTRSMRFKDSLAVAHRNLSRARSP